MEPWTTSPRGTKPGPATLATSRPGQASKYVDYWRENKWESSKQTRDAFGWHFPLRFKHTTIPSFIILHAFHKKGNMSHQTTIQKGMPFFLHIFLCCFHPLSLKDSTLLMNNMWVRAAASYRELADNSHSPINNSN